MVSGPHERGVTVRVFGVDSDWLVKTEEQRHDLEMKRELLSVSCQKYLAEKGAHHGRVCDEVQRVEALRIRQRRVGTMRDKEVHHVKMPVPAKESAGSVSRRVAQARGGGRTSPPTAEGSLRDHLQPHRHLLPCPAGTGTHRARGTSTDPRQVSFYDRSSFGQAR